MAELGDFVEKILLVVMGIVVNTLIPIAGFKISKAWDTDSPPLLTHVAAAKILVAAVPVSVWGLLIFTRIGMQSLTAKSMYILLESFSGCLIFACATDIMTNKVYDFTWWLAAPAVIIMRILSMNGIIMNGLSTNAISTNAISANAISTNAVSTNAISTNAISTNAVSTNTISTNALNTAALSGVIGLALFFIIQEKLCCRLYGRADCHAFCICAAAAGSLGLGIIDFFTHMTLAFLLLSIIQHLKKNAGSNGKLKKPVAFMPYIMTAFWIELALTLH